MFYNDHEPAHFHATYAGNRATIEIDPIRIRDGWLPHRATSVVIEWAALHQRELAEDWALARARRPQANPAAGVRHDDPLHQICARRSPLQNLR